MTGPSADFWASLPRKRVAAAVLFTDGDGRVLLVEPTYKEHWEVPGGSVEVDEAPYAAAVREVKLAAERRRAGHAEPSLRSGPDADAPRQGGACCASVTGWGRGFAHGLSAVAPMIPVRRPA